ncbi:MAG: DNA-binding response regulator [Actinobacteria bacterium]|nr:DNA-binding response regulator [Actinomycetota bacterium]NDI18635.1 DNA-binding response regulator [Actinomycetota bacterium]
MDVVLIEDDDAIASSLATGLATAGMVVRRYASGTVALQHDTPELYLIDVGLPDIDGFEVCRRIRATSSVPIIMLTARSEEIDRVFGLEIGADDYVTKPFGLRELIARIRAVTRRASTPMSEEAEVVTVGSLTIDHARHTVSVDGAIIDLTAKEFDLLSYLAAQPGIVHRRNDIMESVWDANWYGPTKTLDAHVAALRKKLGNPTWIEAVRGVGFRLEIPS